MTGTPLVRSRKSAVGGSITLCTLQTLMKLHNRKLFFFSHHQQPKNKRSISIKTTTSMNNYYKSIVDPFNFFSAPDPSKRAIVHKSFDFLEHFTPEKARKSSAPPVATICKPSIPTIICCHPLFYYLAPQLVNQQQHEQPTSSYAIQERDESQKFLTLLCQAPTVKYSPYLDTKTLDTDLIAKSFTFARHLQVDTSVCCSDVSSNYEEKFYKAISKSFRFIESIRMPRFTYRSEGSLSEHAVRAISSENFPNLETLKLQAHPKKTSDLDLLLNNTKRSLRALSIAASKERIGLWRSNSTYFGQPFVEGLGLHCIRLQRLSINCFKVTNDTMLEPFETLNCLEVLELTDVVISTTEKLNAPSTDDDTPVVSLERIVESFSHIRDGICRCIRHLSISLRNEVGTDEEKSVQCRMFLHLLQPRQQRDAKQHQRQKQKEEPSLFPRLLSITAKRTFCAEQNVDECILSLASGVDAPQLESLSLADYVTIYQRDAPVYSADVFRKCLPGGDNNKKNKSLFKCLRLSVAWNFTKSDAPAVEKNIYDIITAFASLEELKLCGGCFSLVENNLGDDDVDHIGRPKLLFPLVLNDGALISSSLMMNCFASPTLIRTLDLRSVVIGDNFLEKIGQSGALRTSLQTLEIRDTKKDHDTIIAGTRENDKKFISDRGLQMFLMKPSSFSNNNNNNNNATWTNLTSLSITDATNISDECAAAAVKAMPMLKVLSFIGCTQIGDELCKAIEGQHDLLFLDLSQTSITGENFKYFHNLHNMKKLCCDRCSNLKDLNVFKPLNSLCQLRSLSTYESGLRLPPGYVDKSQDYYTRATMLKKYLKSRVIPDLFDRELSFV